MDKEEGSPTSVADVIERVGLGKAQLRTGLLGGGIWLSCGAELILIGTVSGVISAEWHLEAWQRGSLVSVVFIGILAGNAVCGPLGDMCGRRIPILLSYAGVTLFSIASALTQSYEALCAVRLFVGIAIGLGQPAFNTLCSEVTPAYWRILMNSACQSLFIVGEIYSALLVWYDDPYVKRSAWRWLLVMGTLPSITCGILAYFFLLQSPSYLAVRGEHDAARGVLESMGNDNSVHGAAMALTPLPHKSSAISITMQVAEPVALIFSRRLVYSTLTVLYSCFTLNVVFYGVIYAMPQVVTKVDMGHSPAMSLLQGALFEVPGSIMAVICGMLLPRKPVMITYLAAVSASLLAFASGAAAIAAAPSSTEVDWLSPVLLHSGYMGIKCFAGVGFVAVYQYATEIYPTVARTTGSAACVAGGRVGGMVAPMIFEFLLRSSGSFEMFFHLIALLCLVNFVLVIFLPFETFGKALQDDIGEDSPLTGVCSSAYSGGHPRPVLG